MQKSPVKLSDENNENSNTPKKSLYWTGARSPCYRVYGMDN